MRKQAVIASFFISIILLAGASFCSCAKSTPDIPNTELFSATPDITVTPLSKTETPNTVIRSLPNTGPLSITTTLLPNSFVAAAYYQTLTASGGSGTYTNWTILFGTLSDGLLLNPTTGVISGIPVAGSCSFTVQVTDSNGQTATKELGFSIAPLS